MGTHDAHGSLPGFDQRQILVDGCGECEHRSADVGLALAHLDAGAFEEAYQRAVDWQRDDRADLALSEAEIPLLRWLWTMAIMLERRGIPIGTLPGSRDGHA